MPLHPSDEEVAYHKYFHDLVGRQVRTAAFIHSCVLRSNTAVLEELIRMVVDSGLRRRLDGLFVVNLGDELSGDARGRCAAAGVHVIEYSKDVSLYERPTLDLVRLFSRFNAGSRVLYLHTKGVSHASPRPFVDDWRRYMLYFLVEHHEACLSLLERHDTVGCDLLDGPRRHYSGNFWWANADYVRGLLPIPAEDRHACEWWLLSGEDVDACSLWNSALDHYRHPYARHAYDTEATRRRLERYARRGVAQGFLSRTSSNGAE